MLRKLFCAFVFSGCSVFASIITVGVGGDQPTIPAAIAAANNGDTLLLLSGNTFTLAATQTINQSLTILGQDQSSCVVQGNIAFFPLFNITASNVVLQNFTLYQMNNTGFITGTSQHLAGLLFDSLIIKIAKYGIGVKQCSFTLSNSSIIPLGPDRHYGVLMDGNEGESLITNVVYDNQGTNLTDRFIYLTDVYDYSGVLTITNNRQTMQPLGSFFLMDGITGFPQSFSLIIDSNQYQPGFNGITLFTGVNNVLDLFSLIQITNNSDTGTDGKGLFCIDGFVGPSIGTNPSSVFIIYQNISQPITDPGFSSATGNQTISYNNTLFNPVHIALPPYNLGIHTITQKFATQGDNVQNISWNNADPLNIVKFRVYLNNALLTEVTETSLDRHHFPSGIATKYFITAVDAYGDESRPMGVSN